MNYTKGEWQVHPDFFKWVMRRNEEGLFDTIAIAEGNEETAKANAHLIAAAPDMYEALKGLEVNYNLDNMSIVVKQDVDCVKRVFAALAKAEGGEG